MTVPSVDTDARADSPARTFDDLANDIYGWAYRVLGRHHDALDVVQDVFVKWDRQCQKEPPRQPRGWLRRATLNRSIDVVRQRRGQHGGDAITERAESVEPERPRLVGMDQDELRADVAAALDQLTEMQRAVLVAKVYDELTFAQIGAELDLALSTAKTHYVRALARVGERLRPRWDQEDLS